MILKDVGEQRLQQILHAQVNTHVSSRRRRTSEAQRTRVLKERYSDVVNTVFKYRDSRDKLIKKTVIIVLPSLAAFAPEDFSKNHLEFSMNYLISLSKKESDSRPHAFISIGQVRCQKCQK